MTFLVRTAGNPMSVAPRLRSEVAAAGRGLLVRSVGTLEEQVDAALVEERMLAMLSGFFAAVAAVLAAIGLYGTVAYSVARRTREIGIRMALGAPAGRVAHMVLRDSFVTIGLGLAAGVPAAWAAAHAARRLIGPLLFGLAPTDPLTIALAAALILAVSAAAAALPAWRAARVDPMIALRQE
jgi:ABC-type antimicrobial peptide transport system permease subunit